MKNPLTFKIFLLIVLNDVGDALGQILMKKGLLQNGITDVTFSNLLSFFSVSASSSLIWLGLLVYVLNFFVWILILTRVDLSIALPVGSTSYIFIPLLAMFFLHENISLLRWVAILIIAVGIHLVAQSKPSVGREHHPC